MEKGKRVFIRRYHKTDELEAMMRELGVVPGSHTGIIAFSKELVYWVIIEPDHDCYADIFSDLMHTWPLNSVRELRDMAGLPHITRELARVEIERRGKS